MSDFGPNESGSERLRTRRCELVLITRSLALEILAGKLGSLPHGEGWPHAGTTVAASLVLARPPAEVWMIQVAGRTIGDCGTHGPADSAGRVEIGYGLAEPYRGHGYATEAVTALTRHLASRPGVTRVFARTAPENIASWTVLERAGFLRVGSSESAFEYEFLAERPR